MVSGIESTSTCRPRRGRWSLSRLVLQSSLHGIGSVRCSHHVSEERREQSRQSRLERIQQSVEERHQQRRFQSSQVSRLSGEGEEEC